MAKKGLSWTDRARASQLYIIGLVGLFVGGSLVRDGATGGAVAGYGLIVLAVVGMVFWTVLWVKAERGRLP